MEKIKELIKDVLDKGIELNEGPLADLSEYSRLVHMYLTKIYYPQMKLIEDLLKNDPKISEILGKTLSNGQGGGGFNSERLANWLVVNSKLTSIDSTINVLNNYLSMNHNEVIQVLAFSGLYIEEEIQFSKNLKLIPYNNLPLSFQKENLYPLAFRPEILKRFGIPPLDPYEGNYRAPSAAFVKEINVTPKISGGTRDEIVSNSELIEALDFLVLIPGCSPSYSGEWNEFKESVPCKYIVGGGSTSFLSSMGHSIYRLNPDTWEKYRELYFHYRNLSQNERDKLKTPLNRLNQSRNKPRPMDKVLDLGIAFEAFFLSDAGSKEQISYKLRLRASMYLGDNLSERINIMSLISAFYDCRSSVAHSGNLKEEVKIKHVGKVKVTDIINEADTYLVSAINKAILSGGFPAWEEFVLQG